MLLKLWLSFIKVGLFSFGGGLAMLPIIQSEVVSYRHWLTERTFLDVIAISQVTPGPIALNAATFCGYSVGKIPGAIVATLGVILPSFLICLTLAVFLKKIGDNAIYKNTIDAVKSVATALILVTVVFLWKESMPDMYSYLIFALAFIAMSTGKINPPLIMILSGVLGIVIF